MKKLISILVVLFISSLTFANNSKNKDIDCSNYQIFIDFNYCSVVTVGVDNCGNAHIIRTVAWTYGSASKEELCNAATERGILELQRPCNQPDPNDYLPILT